ncbi:MAG: GTPase Era [Pseudomonadales bacterium]
MFKSGYVAIVGRPNVGKSTLLNSILGQKISITSRKPQTTRHNILGIHTSESAQMMFLDTPGQHLNTPRAINRYMNRAASNALADVDVVIFVIDRLKWNEEDEMVLTRVIDSGKPCVVAVNKTDRLSTTELLLPHIQELSERLPQAEFVPVSALKNNNVDRLLGQVEAVLLEGEAFFDEDQVTDRSMRFMAAEIVREKIMRQLGDEVPYAAAVEIERYEFQGNITFINALVLVEREGQKSILIGEKGTRLKQIGMEARKDIEELCGTKVMLEVWVKVKSNWSDDERALRSLGYD